MNVNIYRGDLQACRVCLATDIKLISLHDFSLKRTYSVFSGLPITPTDGLPQHICVFCCALLKKYSEFKDKCKATYTFLSRNLCDIHPLTTSYVNTLDRSNYRISLCITNILECNCVPDEKGSTYGDGLQNTETMSISDEEPADLDCLYKNSEKDYDDNLKNEDFVLEEEAIKHIKKESTYKIVDETDDDLENEDFALEEEVIYHFEKEFTHETDDETGKQKDNLTADAIISDNKKRIKDFKIKYFNKHMDSDKESFYFYILEKYVTKSKKQFHHDLFENNSNVNASEVTAFISLEKEDLKSQAKNETSTRNIKQARLYEYINNKYATGNISAIKQKKVKDILRMKEKKIKGHRKSLAEISEKYNVDVMLMMLREEKIQDLLKRKKTENYEKSKYKCDLCFMAFATQNAFENHKALHDPSLPFECEFCHVRFRNNRRLKSHLTVQHLHKFVCRQCGRVLRSSFKVREHYRSHNGRSYPCELCGKSFDKYASRMSHVRIHHGYVSCEICHMKFTGEAGLVAHKSKAHRELFKCPSCLIQFHNANALRVHSEETVHGCATHVKPCTQCGISFSDDLNLRNHIFDVHPPDRHKPEDKRIRVRRPTCGPTIPGRKADQQELICEICAMGGFKFPSTLRDHQLRKHSDERPCVCDHCNKTFKSRVDILNHITSVHGARRYSCPLPNCSKAFRQHHHLTSHLRAHSSEKAFSCNICERPFKHPESLREHTRIVHEGKPPQLRSRNKKRM